jgi:hypothetical protein
MVCGRVVKKRQLRTRKNQRILCLKWVAKLHFYVNIDFGIMFFEGCCR